MKKRLLYIAPLQLGTVFGALYGLLSLVFVPFVALFILFAPHPSNATQNIPQAFSLIFLVFIPFIYGFMGFILGLIMAVIYNFVAKLTGGIEFKVVEVPEA